MLMPVLIFPCRMGNSHITEITSIRRNPGTKPESRLDNAIRANHSKGPRAARFTLNLVLVPGLHLLLRWFHAFEEARTM